MKVGSLFSGIGGFDLAAKWMGWETVWHSEIDQYACAVFAEHFPRSQSVGDIRTWGPTNAHSVDLICGGFPCQPVSVAGKRLAQDDERWLWPHFARVIRTLRPRYVVVENVPGLLTRGMGDVLGDLSEIGYDCEWESIPASAVGAPHRRDRVWIVAYTSGDQLRHEPRGRSGESRSSTPVFGDDGPQGSVADAEGDGRKEYAEPRTDDTETTQGRAPERGRSCETMANAPGVHVQGQYDGQGQVEPWGSGWWTTEPDVGRVAHGVPSRVDRVRCLGNAIVPQVAYWIFQQIQRHENMKHQPRNVLAANSS